MDLALIQTALNVLRDWTESRQPRAEDLALLRACLGSEADGMEMDELARTIIERCMLDCRKSSFARC